MTWAVVPLKRLALSKTRLSAVLTPTERRALVLAMVEDLLTVLAGDSRLDGITLISDDPVAVGLADRYDVEWLRESDLGGGGLNASLSAARELLGQRGVEQLMVLHSDLPLLRGTDIGDLLQAYDRPGVDVVLAPDLAGLGTNVLLLPVVPALRLHYGVGSCPAHQRAAAALGLRLRLLQRESTGLDVDDPADLLRVRRSLRQRSQQGHAATRCSRLLLAADLDRRLSSRETGGPVLHQLEEQYDAN